MNKSIIAILFILLPLSASAQNYYVRAGASGDGSSWTNAYAALPATLVRGATYYIAAGSYDSYTFNTANSGTTTITIKKATVAEHGSSTGWNDNYAGQAEFAGITVFRGYLTIDGVYRNESNWRDSDSYGFRVVGGITSNTGWDVNAYLAVNVTVQYVDIGESSVGNPTCTASTPGSGIYVAHHSQDNWRVSRCHIHNVRIPIIAVEAENFIVEYCHIGPSWAKEAISNRNASGWIIRHNVLMDNLIYPPVACQYGGDGGTAEIWTRHTEGANDNWEIYGNVFGSTGLYAVEGMSPISESYRTNGIILGNLYGGEYNDVSGWKVYNNTFYAIRGTQNKISIGPGNNNVVANNLWYGSRGGHGGQTQVIGIDNNGSGALTYTTWCNSTPYNVCPSSPGTWIAGTDNPFVDAANLDFRLAASISGNSPVGAGIALGVGFDSVDAFGNNRGTVVWDIGAYAYTDYDPPACSPSRRDLCTIDNCETTGEGYWYNGTCNATPEPTPGTRSGAPRFGTGKPPAVGGKVPVFVTAE